MAPPPARSSARSNACSKNRSCWLEGGVRATETQSTQGEFTVAMGACGAFRGERWLEQAELGCAASAHPGPARRRRPAGGCMLACHRAALAVVRVAPRGRARTLARALAAVAIGCVISQARRAGWLPLLLSAPAAPVKGILPLGP